LPIDLSAERHLPAGQKNIFSSHGQTLKADAGANPFGSRHFDWTLASYGVSKFNGGDPARSGAGRIENILRGRQLYVYNDRFS
jgi:hypothetical protein